MVVCAIMQGILMSGVFNKNKSEIKERVIGSVIRHFILIEQGHASINHDSLKAIARTKKQRNDFMAYLEDTMEKMECFFHKRRLPEICTDHQCDLILSIYRDYSKMKDAK